MSLLAPLFLLAGLAVGLPVIFHLIRRTTRQQTQFSSLMFLFPSPPRLTRRSRLEHIFLLLLRCAAICLLALGFSRPFIKKAIPPAPSRAAKRILVLVDTSASMRRPNLWADARERVQSVLRQTSSTDQLALFAFDRNFRPLMNFDQWNAAPPGERSALALRSLADTTPGWAATRLDSALLRAAEILADTDKKQTLGLGEIILISDLQEGSHVELLQGAEWPRNVQVSVELLKPRQVSNAALQMVAEPEDGDPKTTGEVRLRVSNAADSRRDQFRVGWSRPEAAGFEGNPTEIYVPAGQSRAISLPGLKEGAFPNRVLLQGDEEEFDNSVFTLPSEVVRVHVLYLGAESAADPKQPLYFLRRALQDTRREVVQLRAQAPSLPLGETEVETADMVVVHDSAPANLANTLRSSVANGKTIFCILKDRAEAETLAGLLGLNNLDVTEVRPANYVMLGEIDLRDPLFAPFADPRFSDFTGIHFWKYRRLDPAAIPQARVLARFDNGDPALLQVSVGKGRIFVLTSSWAPQDSQLALSTKFVPLLYSMLESSGAQRPAPARYFVGDTVPIPAGFTAGASGVKIVTPDHKELSLNPGETNFSGTVMPGIYSIASSPPVKRFAVNIDPAESRTSPLSVDDLEHLGVPLKRPEVPASLAAQRTVRLNNAELENRQKLWRWLLGGAFLILLLETWLGGQLHRRASGELSPVSSAGEDPVVQDPTSVPAVH